jgi:hypothetical protein
VKGQLALHSQPMLAIPVLHVASIAANVRLPSSPMDDYARFCEVLVTRGRKKHHQWLQESTVELMFTDQPADGASSFTRPRSLDLQRLTSTERKQTVSCATY